jgi:hypothetical protein
MLLKNAILAVALTLAATSLTACGGGDSEIKATTTTTGQELLDLQKAYESGAISKEEYEEQREKILEGD